MTQASNSSQVGYLAPTTPPTPLEDGALDAFMQSLVQSITQIPANYVRPLWSPTAPIQPAITVDWVAVGIRNQVSDVNAYTSHYQLSTGGAADVLQRHESFELQCSFYGPDAGSYAGLMRDGISIAQNRELLNLNGMGLIKVGDINNMSVQVNNQWYRRLDLIVYIRRNITRVYPVLDLLSSSGSILTTDASWNTVNEKED